MPTVAAIIERVETEKREETKERPKPKPRLVAPVIPIIREIGALEEYLGRLQAAFERSTTGAILDMARDKAFNTKPCKLCGGSGVLGEVEDMFKVQLKLAESKRPILDAIAELYADCPKCHGAGCICTKRGAGGVKLSREEPFEPIDPVEAKPGSGDEYSIAEPPADDVLIKYARVSRHLMRMLPSDREPLCAACGPEGQSWANDKRGRVWAVLRCTDAGRRLIESDPGLTPDKRIGQRLTEIADIQEKSATPNKSRGKQLQEAIFEASAKLTKSILAWNATFEDGEQW